MINGDDDSEEAASLRKRRQELSERICVLCGQGFSLLFNRRLTCGTCGLGVCRKCSSWNPQENSWLCHACKNERELKKNCCQWFHSHLRERFKNFGTAKVISSTSFKDNIDLDSAQVRDHLEKLIESLIGGGLDDASILSPRPKTSQSEVHRNHHGRLKSSLIAFNEALYSVLKSDPTSCQTTTPISAHSNVKEAIQKLQRDVALNQKKLSEGGGSVPRDSPSLRGNDLNTLQQPIRDNDVTAEHRLYLKNTYEDLLSTAIINKVLEDSVSLVMDENGGEEREREKASTKMEISILTLKKEFLPKIAWRAGAARALAGLSAETNPDETDRIPETASSSFSYRGSDDAYAEVSRSEVNISKEFTSLPPSVNIRDNTKIGLFRNWIMRRSFRAPVRRSVGTQTFV